MGGESIYTYQLLGARSIHSEHAFQFGRSRGIGELFKGAGRQSMRAKVQQRGISSMDCMCSWMGTLNTRREKTTALMVTPLFVENRTGILFGSTVHIRNRTTDFWHTTSLVHAYGKSDDDDMMTVLSNLMVRAPKNSLSSPCTSSGRRPSTFLS